MSNPLRTLQAGVWIGLCLACTAVSAESDSDEVGDTTRQWIDLQKSGEQASEHRRPMSGPVAQRSYQRYLRSFEREIPEKFERESTTNR